MGIKNSISRGILCFAVALVGITPMTVEAKRARGKKKSAAKVRAPLSNTQTPMPHERAKKGADPRLLDFADVDGDGVEEWLVAQGKRLFVAKMGLQAIGAHYGYLSGTAERLFAAHMRGKADAEVCVVVNAPKTKRRKAGRYVECFALKRGRKNRKKVKFRRMLSQSGVIPSGGHIFPGDFDGDGKDELLIYQPKSGALSALSLGKRKLVPKPGFSLGALTKKTLRSAQLRVGRLTSDRFDSLLVHHRKAGDLRLYTPKKTPKGMSFKAGWTTRKGFVGSGEYVSVANTSGDSLDEIILHTYATGENRFYEGRLGKKRGLKDSSAADPAEIKTFKKSHLVWAVVSGSKVRGGHKTSRRRHDPVVEHWSWGKRRAAVHVALWDKKAKRPAYGWFFTQRLLHPDLDQDGDGIETGWELGGYDPFNNGLIFEALNEFGASPFIKDIFVEVDYMPGFKMKPAAIALATKTMAKAGINLHIVQDEKQGNVRPEIPLVNLDAEGKEMADGLGHEDVPWPEDGDEGWRRYVDPIKDRYFTPTRWSIFHYCLFVNQYWDDASSDSTGYSRGIPGSDFIVAQPEWVGESFKGDALVRIQAGTFLHELGHNLGLNHAGIDPKTKKDDLFYIDGKPNHVSVMNYNLQFGYEQDGDLNFSYSSLACEGLAENSVSESSGIQCSGLEKGSTVKVTVFSNNCEEKFGDGHQITIGQATDFNATKGSRETLASFDANCDGDVSTLPATRNEYRDLKFKGGLIGTKPGKRFKLAIKSAISKIFSGVKGKKRAPPAAGLAKLKSVRKLLKKRSWKVKNKKKRRLREMNGQRFRRLVKSLKKTPKLKMKSLKSFKVTKKRTLKGKDLAKTGSTFNPKIGLLVTPKLYKGAGATKSAKSTKSGWKKSGKKKAGKKKSGKKKSNRRKKK